MLELLGDLERLLASLYPYRIPVSVGAVLVLAALTAFAWRRGWVAAAGRLADRHRIASVIAVGLMIAVIAPASWYLASPLWTRTTLIEESPFEVARRAETPVTPSASGPLLDNREAPRDEPTQPTMPAVEEEPQEPFQPREARRGVWEGADAFHFAEGDALIIEVAPGRYVLRVENFSVRNGPDLFMYLSPALDGYADGGLTLGELRATDGAFNYEIPEGTDLSLFQSAVVWCERFAVLFATATLE